jgi:hypothetical protein
MQLQIVASRKEDAFDLVFAAESGTANHQGSIFQFKLVQGVMTNLRLMNARALRCMQEQ